MAPSTRHERRMAWLTGAVQAAMGTVLWFAGARVIAIVLFALSAVFLLTSALAPAAAAALFRRWTAGAHAVGVAITVVLFSLMFVVLLPFFLVVRRGDPLRKRLGAATYWEPAPPHDPSMDRALRQY